jgi:lipid A 3-O-deacylase
MQKLLIYSCIIFLTITASAQSEKADHFSSEFSFATDNDAYLFRKQDAYYTNGFFFALKTAQNKKGKRSIHTYELGQMIYTPLIRKTAGPEDIDRPYCGFLFLKFSKTQFPSARSVLQYSSGIGQVGNASFGENVQNSYHALLNYSRFTGWQYQVRNALGIDLGITYAHTLLEEGSWIKLAPLVQANLGMTFTNAKLGAYLCLGSFESNANSALWNARVQKNGAALRRKYELFVYWYPQVILQGYNATVQGGMFHKGSGAVLGEIEPWMFQQTWGVCYAEGRWTTQLALIHQAKEAVLQKKTQQYGSIQVGYRFH